MNVNKTSSIKLAGRTWRLTFDMNAYGLYEQATHKFFFETYETMAEALSELMQSKGNVKDVEAMADADKMRIGLAFIRRIPIDDLRWMVWAGVVAGEASLLPCRLSQAIETKREEIDVAELCSGLGVQSVLDVLLTILRSQKQNEPTKEDVEAAISKNAKDKDSKGDRPTVTAIDGGEPSTEPPDIPFDLQGMSSAS